MAQDVAQILGSYAKHPVLGQLLEKIGADEKNIYLRGLAGSSVGFVVAGTTQKVGRISLVVMDNKEEAAYLFTDLSGFFGEKNLYYFPSSYKRSVQYGQTSPEAIIQRTDVFNLLKNLEQNPQQQAIIVTYPDALIERVVGLEELSQNSLSLKKGENVSPAFVAEVLNEYGFQRVEFVYEPGQYSVRGGIVDIFSYSSSEPYRIDFFGDSVDSIRTFDVDDQLSREIMDSISIIPNVQHNETPAIGRVVVTEIMPANAIIWCKDTELVLSRLNDIYAEAQDTAKSPEEFEAEFVSSKGIFDTLKNHVFIELGLRQFFSKSMVVEFNTAPQPLFNKNFELLAQDIEKRTLDGYQTYILAENPNQHERLTSILQNINPNVNFVAVRGSLSSGFIDHTLRCCFYTDHQIFDRYQKFKLKHELTHKDAMSIQELVNLQKGDYVVHIDHGIGVFGGLISIDVNGKKQEAIRLIYRDNDTLLVNVHNLHKISKYRGRDAELPKVNKLGSAAWQKLKQSTKRKIKDIAKDLIALYAKRKSVHGFAFSPDSFLQHELEASFFFEDTPDQMKATAAVKEDMEDDRPMDRLVCGDVGFGKTEIAVRAAFKAVADSKQVAVLVPTTILALQHYQTFRSRLKNLPCTVEFINRMKTTREQYDIQKRLEEGRIDILIGTHSILGKMVRFKDLGLLIVDEEQKFGVSAKEKLKQLRTNVDTLTLTATPIPRTLQFSLMGARDLSIINTPPPNRHPILTELHEFSTKIIKEAIEFEIARGGQVFFVHNRVQNIGEVELMIHRTCPRIKTGIAHGQMDAKQLEKIMLSFINGDFDVLISTSIIESGLDIPNANTMIVNNAQNFGLSDLHQMRGRVGRSNKKAFCYLLAPPLSSLSNDARRRLKAIEEFSELGSGFSIAMQDLDIRGAGNLLGGEQSGFIADIGFETYQRILDEAIEELHEAEYKNNPNAPIAKEWHPVRAECHIETDMEILIPESFVSSTPERIKLYREIDALKDPIQMSKFCTELRDRFGVLPQPVEDLLSIVKLRWIALDLGFERLIMKNGLVIAHFISNQLSPFYRTDTFTKIMGYISLHPQRFKMKESNGKLSLSIVGIDSINNALVTLEQMKKEVNGATDSR